MLEWVGSFEGRRGDFERLYENDEVAVGTHSAFRGGTQGQCHSDVLRT